MKRFAKLSLLAGILLSTVFLTACYEDFFNTVDGNGILVKEERSTIEFNNVELRGEFEVSIEKDSVYSVSVEAESSIEPYILMGVRNNTLIIKAKDNTRLRNTLPMKIHITMPDVNKLTIAGSGDIALIDTFQTKYFAARILGSGDVDAIVDADEIELDIAGSGDINLDTYSAFLSAEISGTGTVDLEGVVTESEMKISGSGRVKSFDLQQNVCTAIITGSGSIYVNASQLLDVTISGSGKVYYKGVPTLVQEITGSGSVVKVN